MTDNLRYWTQFDDVDPKFTKAITGKDYKGTSPNPQYVIKCLTEMFGPVGQGFGWRVLEEGFQPLGETVLHWCRIEFWHTDRSQTWEAYGQTKAAYPTSSGSFRVDEDAPKKSLTDAIVKAASQVGVAANIFLGRWDDSRYVAQVNQEYRAEEQAATQPAQEAPPPDPAKVAASMVAKVNEALTLDTLNAGVRGQKFVAALDWLSANHKSDAQKVRDAIAARRTALAPVAAE